MPRKVADFNTVTHHFLQVIQAYVENKARQVSNLTLRPLYFQREMFN